MGEPLPPIVRAILVVLLSFLLWNAYMVFVRPRQWMDWMYAKPLKRWGLKVTVEDERKFRRIMKFFGMAYILGAVFFLGLILFGRF